MLISGRSASALIVIDVASGRVLATRAGAYCAARFLSNERIAFLEMGSPIPIPEGPWGAPTTGLRHLDVATGARNSLYSHGEIPGQPRRLLAKRGDGGPLFSVDVR